MGTKYIGLTGKAGSGKDYVENYLRELIMSMRGWTERIAFADGVREEVSTQVLAALGYETQTFGDVTDWQKPYTIEQRRLLQWWGTDFRRKQDPDYWVKYGMSKAVELATRTMPTAVVFTDVRFANEAKAIQELGGQVFEVIAPDSVRRERTGGVETPSHASEDMDFEVDGLILNPVDGKDPVLPIPMQVYLGIRESE